MPKWLCRIAWWLQGWLQSWAGTPYQPIVTDPVEVAARKACAAQGLPKEAPLSFDVASTGKLPQVLYHAALDLDLDHSIRTLGDVIKALKGER